MVADKIFYSHNATGFRFFDCSPLVRFACIRAYRKYVMLFKSYVLEARAGSLVDLLENFAIMLDD